MTLKERYLTALRGGKPDQVPVSLSIGPSNAKRWLGSDDWRAVLKAHKIIGSIPAQDFDLDYYTTNTNPIFKVNWPPGWGETIETRPIPDKFVGFHLTGKVRDLLPIMLEAKPDTILRFESPRFGGDISLGEVKGKYGDQICIMGGFDPHVYVLGDREDNRAEAKRCIDEAAAGGGYILADTDHIPEGAELEDVKYMVEVAREYGQYR